MPPKEPTPCAAAAGNEPAVQVTAQTQAPLPLICPVPVWISPAAGAAGAAGAAAGGASAGGAAEGAAGAAGAAAGGVPPVMALGAPLPFCWIAMDWNRAWVFSAVGLMENVMPLPQWLAWAQKNPGTRVSRRAWAEEYVLGVTYTEAPRP